MAQASHLLSPPPVPPSVSCVKGRAGFREENPHVGPRPTVLACRNPLLRVPMPCSGPLPRTALPSHRGSCDPTAERPPHKQLLGWSRQGPADAHWRNQLGQGQLRKVCEGTGRCSPPSLGAFLGMGSTQVCRASEAAGPGPRREGEAPPSQSRRREGREARREARAGQASRVGWEPRSRPEPGVDQRGRPRAHRSSLTFLPQRDVPAGDLHPGSSPPSRPGQALCTACRGRGSRGIAGVWGTPPPRLPGLCALGPLGSGFCSAWAPGGGTSRAGECGGQRGWAFPPAPGRAVGIAGPWSLR